jgi:tripeptide aminopeptidase
MNSVRDRESPEAERLISLFCALASIPSPSGSERACGDAVIAELTTLGLEVRPDGIGASLGSDCDNLYCRIPATTTGTPVFFCAHLDTVPPTDVLNPVLVDGVLRNATPSIVGADNKAALVVILETIRTLVIDELPHAGVELIFTISEELGLVGSTAFDCSVIHARSGYVLDHPGAIGGYVQAAPSRFVVRARMHGRAAHSGIAPEDGINAIVPLAGAIAALPATSKLVNVNVGRIEGGSALNIVPDFAEASVDVRAVEASDAEQVVAEIEAILKSQADQAGCALEVDVRSPYSAYRVPQDSVALRLALAAFAHHGLPVKAWDTRGGSDANAFCKQGLDCLNLTHAAVGFHAPDEHVAVSDLVLMKAVLLSIIAESCG